MKHFYVPELEISKYDTAALVMYFYQNHHKMNVNAHAGLNFLLLDQYPPELQRVIDKINPTYFERAYFYANSTNVAPHIDKRRGAIISIPLLDPVVPASFEDEDVYYDGPTVFNTQLKHWVDNPGIQRLFIQIELKHSMTIEECYDIYYRGELV